MKDYTSSLLIGVAVGAIISAVISGFDDTIQVHELRWAQQVCEINETVTQVQVIGPIGGYIAVNCVNGARFVIRRANIQTIIVNKNNENGGDIVEQPVIEESPIEEPVIEEELPNEENSSQ